MSDISCSMFCRSQEQFKSICFAPEWRSVYRTLAVTTASTPAAAPTADDQQLMWSFFHRTLITFSLKRKKHTFFVIIIYYYDHRLFNRVGTRIIYQYFNGKNVLVVFSARFA